MAQSCVRPGCGCGPAGYDCEDLARMHVCNHREHGPGITAMCAKSCGACSTSCGASTATTATDADDDDRNDDGTGSIVRVPRACEAGAVAPHWPPPRKVQCGYAVGLCVWRCVDRRVACPTGPCWTTRSLGKTREPRSGLRLCACRQAAVLRSSHMTRFSR